MEEAKALWSHIYRKQSLQPLFMVVKDRLDAIKVNAVSEYYLQSFIDREPSEATPIPGSSIRLPIEEEEELEVNSIDISLILYRWSPFIESEYEDYRIRSQYEDEESEMVEETVEHMEDSAVEE